MALIVYDGTNPTTAEALYSAADFDAFMVDNYGAAADGTTEQKEATLRRVNSYKMGLPWQTDTLSGYAQTVPFPRVGFDGVPWQVIKAGLMLARAEHSSVGALSPSAAMTDRVKREKIDAIEVEYVVSDKVDASRVLVTDALNLLRPFLQPGALADMGMTETYQSWGIAAV